MTGAEGKHNPGPWEYEDRPLREDRSAYGVVKDADGRVLFDSLNSDVAEIHQESDEDGVTRWDAAARRNLGLAAAAPNLLDAAKAVLAGWYGTKGEVYPADISVLEEAVADANDGEWYYTEWLRSLPPLPDTTSEPTEGVTVPTAIEIVQKLKAQRLAELKAAEDAREAEKRAKAERAEREFAEHLPVLLQELHAGWLMEFYTGAAPVEGNRVAEFAIPGHRPVGLTLFRGADGWFVVQYVQGVWSVQGAQHKLLADALLAADKTLEAADEIPY
jgi:hypothetical protein